MGWCGDLGAATHGTWLTRTHCLGGQLSATAVALWFCGRKETPGASGGARSQEDHCRRLLSAHRRGAFAGSLF